MEVALSYVVCTRGVRLDKLCRYNFEHNKPWPLEASSIMPARTNMFSSMMTNNIGKK